MGRFAFKFISGKYQGGEFPIPEEGELLIGRSGDLDLVLVEDMVSRKHAKLVAQADNLTITDLGSTNGTFVNGEKIRRTTLQRSDRILIGTSILRVIDVEQMTTVTPDLDRNTLKAMMEDLASRSASGSSMSGDLEEVPLPDLLQLFATNKKSGILTIGGEHRGKLYIRGGQLRFAVVGGEVSMPPMKAICRMVGWTKGTFRLEPYEGEDDFPETFEESTESILMEALRQLDELRHLMGEMPPSNAQLALCIPLTPRLADLDPIELDTLQKVINFAQFKTVVDKMEETDFEVVRTIHKLLRDGYLEVE